MRPMQSAECGVRNAFCLLPFAFCLFFSSSALGGANLVANGGFEKHDGNVPESWHIKLTDFMPKEDGKDDAGKTKYRYICACGQDLGSLRPWCGLICPKCGGFISGEECGDWYTKNHERVSLDHGPNGYCVKFTLDKSTGENQGVRIMSHLIKVKPAWGYVLTFSCKTKGSLIQVFAECYGHPKNWKSANWEGPRDKALDKDERIDRTHRAHVYVASCPEWKTFTKEIVAPKRYQFEFISVKLYAYMPGEAWFDNIAIRPMTQKEYDDFISTKKPKDKRFEY